MSTISTALPQASRRDDIDWSRVLGTAAVFLFHVTRFFDAGSWHVKNITQYAGLDLVIGFATQWLMPLFFVLSGASLYWALKPRRVGSFLWARVLRLVVPLLLGMFVIAPPQVYIERVTANGYLGSFPQFYLNDYFHGLYGRGGNFALTGMHLWYVFWLFLFTLVLLPLILFLRSAPGQRVVSGLARVFAHPGTVLALGLLIPVAHIFGEATDTLWEEAGWNVWTYLIILLLGYLLVADTRFDAALRRGWRGALVGALLLSVLMFLIWDFAEEQTPLQYIWQWSVRGVGAWFWLVAMLGAARSYLSFSNRFLRYTSELVMPYYILHQTVIIIVGFFIRNWNLPVLVKYPLLAIVAFGIIMGLYEYAIRRANVLRVLFGLKTTARAAAPVAPPVAPARAGR